MEDKRVTKEKEELYNLINTYFEKDNANLFFADYRGLTFEKFSQIRNILRKNDTQIHVVKNRIAKIILKEKGYSTDIEKFLKGPTALILSYGDNSVVAAKDIAEFTKPEEITFKVKGALVDNVVYDEKSFTKFSSLPTKKELYAKLMGTIQAPITNTASLMNNVISKLARTLKAAVDENKFN